MTSERVIAFYLRLSSEDAGEEEESNSISNQRSLLKFFAAETFKNQKYRISEFVDEGYSGTSFNRPAVLKLLELARDGKISCIMVKDFSRFSRDYIEMGSYLEQIFPFLGIRFISVNDHYDSSEYKGKLPQLDMAFQYLVNDFYAKDISVKVKAALAVKKETGIYANGSTPFGYQKSFGNRHQLIPVEAEAGIVRRIFQMAAEGCSSSQIARQLNKEGVKTPAEYRIARKMAALKPKGEKFIWDTSVICRMLRNDFYAGDMVYGKYETVKVGEKARLKPRKEWKIYKNHHEPIIDRETYEQVQKNRGRTKKAKSRKRHPLTGKMVCGYCRKTLNIGYTRNPYFFCATRYQTDAPECGAQAGIRSVEQLVLQLLRREITRQIDGKEIQKFYAGILKEKYKEILRERETYTGEKNRLQREKLRIYEQYRKKELTREEYLEGKKPLQEKEDNLSEGMKKQEEKIKKVENDLAEVTRNPGYVSEKSNGTELNQDIADLFVDKIIVWDEKRIEILWNFSGSSVWHLFNT